jgi:hypothetical protein
MENFKILCRKCAEVGSCKSENKFKAIKCKRFWEHIPTSDFIKSKEDSK